MTGSEGSGVPRVSYQVGKPLFRKTTFATFTTFTTVTTETPMKD